jgi:hypothetical protein
MCYECGMTVNAGSLASQRTGPYLLGMKRPLGVLTCLLAASGALRPGAAQTFDPARLMSDVQAYYDLGVHRTGYEGDLRTSEWLEQRFRSLGLETDAHRFRIRQFFLDDASIQDGLGRISAFPLWLPRATPPEGVTARLARIDEDTPDAEIRGAIAWLDPARPSGRAALEARAIASGAVAIVFATTDRGGRGLFQQENAERRYVDVQRPIPTLRLGRVREAPRVRRAPGDRAPDGTTRRRSGGF